MLKHIEEKIDVMLGIPAAQPKVPCKLDVAEEAKPVTDEDLLNGPGLKGDAKSQAEIDALLASFD